MPLLSIPFHFAVPYIILWISNVYKGFCIKNTLYIVGVQNIHVQHMVWFFCFD